MTSTLARSTAGSIDLDLDRLGPGFGAEVRGLDLATADDKTVAADPAGADRPQGRCSSPASASTPTARWPWATGWAG